MGASAVTMISAKMIDSFKDYSHLVNQPKLKSRGFMLDILSDGTDGVSIHRFQFVIWTLALTLVFLRGVIRELAMPEFPENLLILIGVSNGTYLLLKLPENTKPITTTPAATDTAVADAVKANAVNEAAVKAAAVAAADAAAIALAQKAKEETPADNITPNVTPEGDVTGRDEEDMSGIPDADTPLISNPANQNQALG
jgi:hypothetical protein